MKDNPGKPTDLRAQRQREQRRLFWIVAAFLVIGGSIAIALVYGPQAAVLGLGCLLAGAGFDTFATGETSHAFFHYAIEWGLNVIYGGHYGTETLGVKALARHLEKRFRLETIFLGIPTGM